MRNTVTISLILTLSFGCGTSFANQPTAVRAHPFDPTPWQQDFSQLLTAMSDHYANLEWAIKGRRMNLVRLRGTTETELAHARSDAEARTILDKFVNAFGDGHFQIEWPKEVNTNPRPRPTEPRDLCQRLGYSTVDDGKGVDFSTLPQYMALAGDEATFFPGGVLRLSGGRKIGVIRIGLFAETGYPRACEQVIHRLNIPETARCNADCQDDIQLHVANYLTTALTRRAEALRKAGATSILVDITNNGGGTNWVEAAVRELSPIPLQDSRYAFIRSSHWTKELEERLHDLETDLAHNRQPHELLVEARMRLQQAINLNKQHCDRSSVWWDGIFRCSQLIKGVLYTSGILPYAEPGSYAGLTSRTVLFHPLRYNYTETHKRLPLYVVVDRNTWSAAEYFAAILQDNHAAIIIGDITGGAGCGYTNGGIPTILKNSKAKVKMPDCVRIRPNGSNAVNGVTPDILVPLTRRDSDYQTAHKIFAALDALP